MTKKLIAFVALLITLALPSAARAHEGHMHKILGTVSKVDGPHVMVKTTAGKDVTVMLDATTTVTRGKEKLDASAIKVGQRISVDAMQEKDMMMAHAVKLAVAQK